MNPKIIRNSTGASPLNVLLKGQSSYLNHQYNVIALSVPSGGWLLNSAHL
jgi:hypothetical protein